MELPTFFTRKNYPLFFGPQRNPSCSFHLLRYQTSAPHRLRPPRPGGSKERWFLPQFLARGKTHEKIYMIWVGTCHHPVVAYIKLSQDFATTCSFWSFQGVVDLHLHLLIGKGLKEWLYPQMFSGESWQCNKLPPNIYNNSWSWRLQFTSWLLVLWLTKTMMIKVSW